MPIALLWELPASLSTVIERHLDEANGDKVSSDAIDTSLQPATRVDERGKNHRLVAIALHTGVAVADVSSLAGMVGQRERLLRHIWEGRV